MKDKSHEEAMAELFRDDPQFAADYLNDLLLDGEPADLLVALRQITQARPWACAWPFNPHKPILPSESFQAKRSGNNAPRS
jgi:hypothetical protein